MSKIKSTFLKIWHDSVGGNIISYLIIAFITWLITKLPKINALVLSLAEKYDTSLGKLYGIFFIVLAVFFIAYWIIRFVDIKRLQRKYHKLYQSKACQLLVVNDILTESPRITKITIAGVESVGKTTLVENLCSKANKNTVTSGKGAYVLNFSNTEYKYGVILDGSGQSQATQNDLALRADILLILLDHNQSAKGKTINENRLERHKQFISLLVDRFDTSNKSPKYVYVIRNKRDLWKQIGNEKNRFEEFCNLQEDFIKARFGSSLVIGMQFSNEITSDRTKLMLEMAKIIN